MENTSLLLDSASSIVFKKKAPAANKSMNWPIENSTSKYLKRCLTTLTLQSLLFWRKKSKGFSPKKARVFLFAEPLKSLEKKGKRTKKARKIGKRKKNKEIEKKQGLEGQGNGDLKKVI